MKNFADHVYNEKFRLEELREMALTPGYRFEIQSLINRLETVLHNLAVEASYKEK